MRKKKYKVQKIQGVKVAVEIKKDHDRPKFLPTITYKTRTDYDRKQLKKETRKLSDDFLC